jgi:hypothetical protein
MSLQSIILAASGYRNPTILSRLTHTSPSFTTYPTVAPIQGSYYLVDSYLQSAEANNHVSMLKLDRLGKKEWCVNLHAQAGSSTAVIDYYSYTVPLLAAASSKILIGCTGYDNNYNASYMAGFVIGLDPLTGSQTQSQRFHYMYSSYPRGLFVESDGKIRWVGQLGNNGASVKLDPSTLARLDVGQSNQVVDSSVSQFSGPTAVAQAPNGSLTMAGATASQPSFLKLNTSGAVTGGSRLTLAGNAYTYNVSSLSVDGSGNYYISGYSYFFDNGTAQSWEAQFLAKLNSSFQVTAMKEFPYALIDQTKQAIHVLDPSRQYIYLILAEGNYQATGSYSFRVLKYDLSLNFVAGCTVTLGGSTMTNVTTSIGRCPLAFDPTTGVLALTWATIDSTVYGNTYANTWLLAGVPVSTIFPLGTWSMGSSPSYTVTISSLSAPTLVNTTGTWSNTAMSNNTFECSGATITVPSGVFTGNPATPTSAIIAA